MSKDVSKRLLVRQILAGIILAWIRLLNEFTSVNHSANLFWPLVNKINLLNVTWPSIVVESISNYTTQNNSKNHQATRSRLTDENLTTSWSLNWYAFFWFWLAWHFQSNKCMQLSVNAKIQFIIDCLGKKCNRHHQHYVRTTNFWQPSERGDTQIRRSSAKANYLYSSLHNMYYAK